MAGNTKNVPKDAKVMLSILKDTGITEYDPRVINQMLEFAFRYTTTILDDAKVYSHHARKKNIDLDDVRLAVQMQVDKSFATPPPRDILMELARQRNNIPLPPIKPQCGLRLPHDRYCLTAANYRLKSNKPPKPPQPFYQTGLPIPPRIVTSFQTNAVRPSMPSPNVNLPGRMPLVNRPPGMPSFNIVTRSAAPGGGINRAPPTPIIRLTSATQPVRTTTTTSVTTTTRQETAVSGQAHAAPTVITRMVSAPPPASPTVNILSSESGTKRKADDV